ncbi:hypothetical protein EF294_07405 [Gordonia oryzae]|uniref:Uncharacterized protein n=2 Tax=Gordonia oryzae TaxID=2487349 RepID=A0A3N4H0M7_9ACTN|nr:hypothetical protein EF294_07405 [Gordonia oryzae]
MAMPEVAEIVMHDGEPTLNEVAAALLFGISVDALRSYATKRDDGTTAFKLPAVVAANGRARTREFARLTGTEDDPDIWDALRYYARQEGVGLVFVAEDGQRRTIEEPQC